MKSRVSNLADLIGCIIRAGIRAIVLAAAIEIVVLAAACGVGIFMWFEHGFLSGVLAGLTSLIVGQFFVPLVLDTILQFPEEPAKEAEPDMADEDVLAALRTELDANIEHQPLDTFTHEPLDEQGASHAAR